MQVAQVALEHGDVVADERQRVVDLVGHAGDELAQAGELLGLHQPALRGLERLVRLVLGVGQLLEHDVLLLELLLGAHPLGDVPEDPLDADRLAVGAEQRRLHDLDVELLALGRDVLLDDVEDLAALDHPAVVAAILLGQLAGKKSKSVLPLISSRRRPSSAQNFWLAKVNRPSRSLQRIIWGRVSTSE